MANIFNADFAFHCRDLNRYFLVPDDSFNRSVEMSSQRANRLGRGIVADLPMVGPSEVRDLTVTFNLRQDRLSRFVADRTRLLAALGHDLRSPLTSLRVRAEMVADDEIRESLVASVEEMQSMVEATLTFARGQRTKSRKPLKLAHFQCKRTW